MEITEKDYLINSLTIVLASKATIAPSELQTLISSELSSYTATKIKTTLPSTGDGSTTKWLFEEFTKQKIAEGIKKSSLKAYMVSVKKLYSYFSKELNLLTSDDIIEFLDWYRLTGQNGKRSANTVRNMYFNLSSFYGWMYNYHYIAENIFTTLKTPKGSIPRKQVISPEEMEMMTIACEKYRVPHKRARDLAIINFLNETGVRVSELCRLTVEDIDFNKGTVQVKKSKSIEDRETYFFDKTKARLREYFEFRDDIQIVNGQLVAKPLTPLFASFNKNHNALSTNSIREELKIIGSISGVDRLHPHLFRSTMITHNLEKGVSPVVIQHCVGHQSLQALQHYECLSTEHTQIEMRRAS